jgi:hypothetical protein
MASTDYQKLVLDTLQGKTPELREIPTERLDWSGPGALIRLFDRTSGAERSALVQAIGQIIRYRSSPLPVIAQLIDFASGFDLAEVEPEVRALQSEPVASEEPLRRSILNYLAYRKLVSNGYVAPTKAREPKRPLSSRRKAAKRKVPKRKVPKKS